MGTPYLAEIRLISFNYAPKGWAFCNGQTMAINQNQALFSLMGTIYGGNGQTTFVLPNLQGRSPMHFGNGYIQGAVAGEVNVSLTTAQFPAHTHQVQGVATVANLEAAAGDAWAAASANPYAASTGVNTTMAPTALATSGGGQPHTNMPPYLVLNFVIALQGIFPSRN